VYAGWGVCLDMGYGICGGGGREEKEGCGRGGEWEGRVVGGGGGETHPLDITLGKSRYRIRTN
jgi:hypothetical protein